MGDRLPRVALLSNGEEPGKGTPELVASTSSWPASGGAGLNFVGNIEGTQVTEGVADVVVMDGFTGNITLKLIEGVSGRTLRAIRDVAMRSPRAKLGGWLLSAGDPAAARRDRSRGARAAPTCSACASSAWSPTAASRAAASRARSRSPPAASGGCDRRARAPAAARAAGALRPRSTRDGDRRRVAPVRAGGYGVVPMNREQIFCADPRPSGRRARGRPRIDPGVDALQGGSRGRFAGPLHARPGARGHATA